ncbi:MAG TPA: ABC transporter permease [Pyrinomonadaceae bacterium]|jgi:putative ABC transport system permease protein|nr:ABC transporter permease [Pyrinomonadaceae bacterium]
MQTLLKDIRYGVRSLLKHPGFTAIVVVTLAVGIGASSAIFSVVNTVLLRPLPYPRAERIVAIQELNQQGKRVQVTPANFLDWRAQNTVFEQLAAILTRPANLALADSAERIDLAMTSANFFSVFGVEPKYGRFFITADEQAGHASIVVISHALWQRRFGGDPSLIGKPITLDGVSYSVVGIAPAGFSYPDKTDVWVPPFRLAPTVNERMDPTQVRGFGMLAAVALLRPGIGLPQAVSEMETITARLRQQYPEQNNRRFSRVVSLHNHLVGETGPMLLLLFGAVGFVLLIACANVANLLLASAATRQKELAIRTALGASRMRLIRQLLTESGMLAFAGGAMGFLLALWGVALLTKLLPQDFPRLGEIRLDWRVLGFTLVTSVVTGILFGFAPALQLSKTEVQDSLKEMGRGVSGSRRHNRLRNLLIVGEVALSVVLLAGAGLLFRSFMQLQSVNTGFNSQQLLTARLTPAGTQYRTDPDYINFYNQTLQRISAVPGVTTVAAINTLPLDKGPQAGFRIEGRPPLTTDKWPGGNYRTVSADYFRAMDIPIVQGRAFTDHDTLQTPLVVIVNQALVRRDFPGEGAIGKRINLGNTDAQGKPVWLEIVGVASDVRSLELREEAAPEFYLSAQQDSFGNMFVVVRTSIEPTGIAAAIRQAAAEVDKTASVSDIKTMDNIVSAAVTQPRFNVFLLGLFSAIALLLSAAGIYGVTAYSVTQRTHEFGIRMALGAQVGDVLRMIVRQGMLLISVGIVVGLAAALALTRLLRTLLFGVSASDPLTFVAITLLLTFVALIACYIPARRATKVDPLVALRYE